MKRGNRGPMTYGSKDEPIDPECLAICDALNEIEGIETISSCCGHGFAPFRIYFVADQLMDLCPILELIDESEEWTMRVSMATGGMEIYFVLDGLIGEAGSVAATDMVNRLCNLHVIGEKEMDACEHGIPKVIICSKCHPEKYIATPEIIARAKELEGNLQVIGKEEK